MKLARPAGIALLVAAACRPAGVPLPPPVAPPDAPNVVVILADDLGWGDLGTYGQEKIHTPRLDRMAAEGMRFTDFYSGSAVCAPARTSLMTGLHTGHAIIRGNREHRPVGQEPLPAGTVTIAELLRETGYATGAFGKWGLGGLGSTGVPTKQGFDTFYGYLDNIAAHFYYPEFLIRDEHREPLAGNKVIDNPPAPGAGPELVRTTYSHDRIVSEAMAFIGKNRARPFFLYLPVTLPHAELAVPEDAMKPYLDSTGHSIFPETPWAGRAYSAQAMPRATYAAMVSRLDRDVGRILDTLRTLGIAEKTIVFFTSDNGPHGEGGMVDPSFFDSNGPFRGMKRDLFEGGIRAPMIAWAPGRIPAGAVSHRVWALWDLFPTLADFAGATLPEPAIDGISALPTLLGHTLGQADHEYLYWEFYEGRTSQAVRQGRWKAVRSPMLRGPVQLFDLTADQAERHDVAAQHPDVVATMMRYMAQAHSPSAIWSAR